MMEVVCCTPKSEWASQSRKTLRATCLNREAKVWHLFINAGVMPTRHLNTLTIDKVALIYSIFKGIKLNMRELISTLIKQKVKEEKVRQLWYPILITELCRMGGVHQGEDDMVTQVGHPITETVVAVNIKVAAGASRKRDMLRIMGADQSAKPPSADPFHIDIPVADRGTDPNILMEQIEYIKAYQRCQHLYEKEQFENIHSNLRKIMEKAKIPVSEPNFRMMG
ncbi:hypothetical protein KSP40_PGU005864 [Platanthera guangdongensis]|uniref:Putative plant transposon protein domain-containing protein n=1 Tax=Platanthera guangdongensis TaxID=2320717 RepID=A0ABR2LYJ7_9ASPA